MIELSTDPRIAEQQIEAIIFYLTTCGYIDDDFDLTEKAFVRAYLRKVVTARIDSQGELDPELRYETIEKQHEHYVEVFQQIDREVKELFTEAVSEGENVGDFVRSKLKLRCFEMFQGLSEHNRVALLQVVDDFIDADGVQHPEEIKFRNELAALLNQDPVVDEADLISLSVELNKPTKLAAREDNHPFFNNFEHHYSSNPETLNKQMEADLKVLDEAEAIFDKQRAKGLGKLRNKQSVDDLEGMDPFLDQHVYAVPPTEENYELIVLGDLHGCYSCLKAALMQADFMEKVRKHKADPENNPNIRLVLLGDYIDRGQFSYNGILRTVLKLFTAAPDYVYVLRGNHEYYIEYEGRVYGGVRPAEAINTLQEHLPQNIFERYLRFFDSMPNMLLFDRTLFVHAGIPRDATINEHWKDMNFLNDKDVRFQMLWSDPSRADVIPDDLQAASARFPFGRQQFRNFMGRLGTNLLVRGHEKVNAGFKNQYPQDDERPMALTIKKTAGEISATPWQIDYRRYQSPELNAFFARRPEIETVH
jgi:hypothetical protein